MNFHIQGLQNLLARCCYQRFFPDSLMSFLEPWVRIEFASQFAFSFSQGFFFSRKEKGFSRPLPYQGLADCSNAPPAELPGHKIFLVGPLRPNRRGQKAGSRLRLLQSVYPFRLTVSLYCNPNYLNFAPPWQSGKCACLRSR